MKPKPALLPPKEMHMKFDDEFDEFDKYDREKSFLRWYVIDYFIGFLITAIVIIILEVTK